MLRRRGIHVLWLKPRGPGQSLSGSLCRSVTSQIKALRFASYSSARHPQQGNRTLKHLHNLNKKTKRDTDDETSSSSIAVLEVKEAVGQYAVDHECSLTYEDIRIPDELIEIFLYSRSRPVIQVDDIEIFYQCSDGTGFGIVPLERYAGDLLSQDVTGKFIVIKIPKTIVGDTVSVQLGTHHELFAEGYIQSTGDIIPSRTSKRRDQLVVCPHFNSCSGCSLQMLPYEYQLESKQKVIQKAYRFFYPEIYNTVRDITEFGLVSGSPLQYAYRTKLTPHYKMKKMSRGNPNIGFNDVNPAKGVVDVKSCSIATSIINQAYEKERRKILSSDWSDPGTPNLATLAFRDSLKIDQTTGTFLRESLGYKKIVTERIEDKLFQFNLSSFFQNNSAILPDVLDFIRHHMNPSGHQYKYLVDTYCGTGFFGICLSGEIREDGKVFGIEISKVSISDATHNAKLNGLPVPARVQFVDGDANGMFRNREFLQLGITGPESVVILDPSRKGSTPEFLRQLIDFKPSMIVYVSCNVFTQARDLKQLAHLGELCGTRYKLESLRGFDFFPQTKHVESVAILTLQDE